MKKLPPLYLTLAEFSALPEYSASYPTGTTPGKRWRRLNGAHDHAFKARGGIPRWQIGEFDPSAPTDAEVTAMVKRGETVPCIAINWYRPVIRVRALSQKVPFVPALWPRQEVWT